MGLVSGMVFRCTIAFLERSRWRFDVRSFVLFVGVFVLVLCLHHVCGFLVYGFGSPSGSFVGECYLFVLGMSVVIGDLFDCGLLLLVDEAVGLCRFLVSLMGCWGQTGFVLFVLVVGWWCCLVLQFFYLGERLLVCHFRLLLPAMF